MHTEKQLGAREHPPCAIRLDFGANQGVTVWDFEMRHEANGCGHTLNTRWGRTHSTPENHKIPPHLDL